MTMMTREHASPANGGACPKTATATRATRQAGPTLRIPTAEERRAVLLALPAETRDRIGLIALDMVFNAFLSGAAYVDEDRVLGADLLAMREASEACDEALMQLHEAVEAALPDLFGAPGEAPAWTVQH